MAPALFEFIDEAMDEKQKRYSDHHVRLVIYIWSDEEFHTIYLPTQHDKPSGSRIQLVIKTITDDLLALGLAVEPAPVLGWKQWGIILWLALVNTAAAFTLWNHTLRTLSAAESSIINNTMMVQIAVLAWVFLGERPGPMQFLGMAFALAGTVMVNLKGKSGS